MFQFLCAVVAITIIALAWPIWRPIAKWAAIVAGGVAVVLGVTVAVIYSNERRIAAEQAEWRQNGKWKNDPVAAGKRTNNIFDQFDAAPAAPAEFTIESIPAAAEPGPWTKYQRAVPAPPPGFTPVAGRKDGFDEARFCATIEEISQRARADVGKMIDAYTRQDGIYVSCGLRHVEFKKTVLVNSSAFAPIFEASTKKQQWNSIYCTGEFRPAIDNGWAIAMTIITEDGAVFTHAATCSAAR